MTSFFTVLGALLAFAIVVAIIASGYLILFSFFTARQEARYYRWKRDEASTVAKELEIDSWWFSEDPPTKNLIKNIAEQISRCGCVGSIIDIRDKWREDRRTHA